MAPPFQCERCQHDSVTLPTCSQCQRLLDIPLGLNHFQVMGLPPHWLIDERKLKDRFLYLSSEVHPDRFEAVGFPDSAFALRWTTALNRAYTVLRHRLDRTRYFLSLNGFDVAHTQSAPPVDLAELYFDLLESDSPEAKARFLDLVRSEMNRCEQNSRELGDLWRGGGSDEPLLQLHSNWVRERYLSSMLDNFKRQALEDA